MSKAEKRKTPIDILLAQKREQKKLFGSLRQAATGISSATAGSIGAAGGGQSVSSPSTGFLKTEGDTMIGPLAFFTKLTSGSELPDAGNNNTLDLKELGTIYTSHVVWGAGGSDQIDIITNATFTGQILFLESTEGVIQTVSDESNVVGPPIGNIRTLVAGRDLVLGPRKTIVQFMFSFIDNFWHQVSNPDHVSIWSEFPATQDVDFAGFGVENQVRIDIQNGICFGGLLAGVTLSSTEEYNFGVWSAGGSLSTAVRSQGGSGNNLDAISTGGPQGAPFTAVTEEYDSVSWSSGGSLNTARGRLIAGGNRREALCVGGDAGGGGSALTEEYSGTVWFTSNNLAQGRRGLGGDGNQLTGIVCGGFKSPNAFRSTEEYNGTSWSAGGNVNSTSIETPVVGGNPSSAIVAGGSTGGVGVARTEIYNGISWAIVANLNTARAALAGGGNTSQCLTTGGGPDPTQFNVTEEFNGTSWVITGNLTTARSQAAGGINFGA